MMTDIRGLTFYLIRCLLKMSSPTVFSSRIYCIINIVHECTEIHVFRESTELQTIEREQTARLALIYYHNNSNNIYSLNINTMKK